VERDLEEKTTCANIIKPTRKTSNLYIVFIFYTFFFFFFRGFSYISLLKSLRKSISRDFCGKQYYLKLPNWSKDVRDFNLRIIGTKKKEMSHSMSSIYTMCNSLRANHLRQPHGCRLCPQKATTPVASKIAGILLTRPHPAHFIPHPGSIHRFPYFFFLKF